MNTYWLYIYTTNQKFWVIKIYLKKCILLFSKSAFSCIKSDIKTFKMLQNTYNFSFK